MNEDMSYEIDPQNTPLIPPHLVIKCNEEGPLVIEAVKGMNNIYIYIYITHI